MKYKNNTGIDNSGNQNSGNQNSGDRNSGNRNSGDWNSAAGNSGNRNSGNRNSGDWNSGARNSGNRNSGNRNSGDWNSGDWNSGMFNTGEPTIRMFNKNTKLKRRDMAIPDFLYFKLTEWVDEENMSDQEKIDNTKFHITGGYLKTHDYKDAFKKAFAAATEDDKKLLFALPNFDAEIFKEISGIDVTKDDDLEHKKAELIKKANKLLEQAENLQMKIK